VAPLVFTETAPVNRLAWVSVMVPFAAEVVKDEVPVTVATPVCVKLRPCRSPSDCRDRQGPEHSRLAVDQADVAAGAVRGERHRAGEQIGRAQRDRCAEAEVVKDEVPVIV